MPDQTETTTTAQDVRRYVDTDMDDEEIGWYITDAEDEALAYNDPEDFFDGELDRLVRFYAALLIGRSADNAGGDIRQLGQGARSVSLTTPGENGRGWLARRVHANDPSGKLIMGRAGNRHVTTSASGSYHDDDDDGRDRPEDSA